MADKKLRAYESGMVREDKSEKINYTLAIDGPMFKRYAIHMTKGAKVHGARNWLKAAGVDELVDFQAGALRHIIQWLNGDTDEDHAAAAIFNINGAELCKEKLHQLSSDESKRAIQSVLQKLRTGSLNDH